MLGTTVITIPTDGIAYSISNANYPTAVIYKAPYTVGDCPVDACPFSAKMEDCWKALEPEDGDERGIISATGVSIISLPNGDYTVGESYEIRIYDSGRSASGDAE